MGQKSNGHKLEHRKFKIRIRKKNFTICMIKCWKMCPEKLWDLHPWGFSTSACTKPGLNSVLSLPRVGG